MKENELGEREMNNITDIEEILVKGLENHLKKNYVQEG